MEGPQEVGKNHTLVFVPWRGAQLSASLGLLRVTLCSRAGVDSIKWGLFKTTKPGTFFLPLCVHGDTEAPLVSEEQGQEQALRRFSCSSHGVLSWDLLQMQVCSVLLSVQSPVSAWPSQAGS